ncbi:MAG TPA: T9SS type A sorting domain-containing protein, partial [Puia sp.]|nr:T9SS type A sorting domain-containing protein [Puia sp.]
YVTGNTVQIYNYGLFAGTGTAGYSGDGGPATNAELNMPSVICEDPDGNVFIGTKGDNRIRKVATDGTISTYAGNGTSGYTGDGGPAIQASIAGINGICGDPYGNVYFTDSLHGIIRKIDTTGKITTFAGTGAPGYTGDGGPATMAQLFRPNGIGMDANRNLYIGEDSINAIRVIDTNGVIRTVMGGDTTKGFWYTNSTKPLFGNITNIGVDDVGDVWFCDATNKYLFLCGPDGGVGAPNNNMPYYPGALPFQSISFGPSGQPAGTDTVDGDLWGFGFFLNPGADSVGINLYAPLPGHPMTPYFETYLTDNMGAFAGVVNRTIQLRPDFVSPVAPGIPFPTGPYMFVVSVDTPTRWNNIVLSARHVKIVAPPGQDSAQDLVTLWVTENDLMALTNYMTSVGDPDPGFFVPYTMPPYPGYVDVSPLKILYFHGADNYPGHVTGPVEEINAAWGIDNVNNLFASPYNDPWDASYNDDYSGTFTVYHGLGGNIYFTTGTLGPLPLTLLSFTAVPQGQDAVLKWMTTDEVNSKDFLVQRSSDTSSFAVVGSVDAVGAAGGAGSTVTGSGSTHSYGYTDKDLAPGTYYYRLKMEDINGQFTYSPIKSVNIGSPTGNFVVYPNPVKDRLYCQIPVTAAGKYTAQITDRDGNVLQTQEASLNTGVATLTFDVSGLVAGVYFVSVSNAGQRQTASFMK